MTPQSMLLYSRLLATFRNGWRLIQTIRGGPPIDVAILWDGTRISHPPRRRGLVEIIVELWLEQPYTKDGFYWPKDGDVIVDAGANVGVFSIWLSRQCSKARIISLEPFAENYVYFESNLRAAGFGPDRVKPSQVALGKAFGQGQMTSVGDRSLDHTLSSDGVDDAGGLSVPIVPLAGLFDLAKADRINLLKVDIEGSEKDAFESVDPETLRRCDRIAIEYHDNIRPGTLALLHERLRGTHDFVTKPSSVEGCGILLAKLKQP